MGKIDIVKRLQMTADGCGDPCVRSDQPVAYEFLKIAADNMIEAADEIAMLREELTNVRVEIVYLKNALAHAIECADDWHDNCNGGKLDTLNYARELLAANHGN